MAEKNLKARIVHKHDTEENWLKATNFTPMQGEIIVYDIDDNHNYERFKIGDGTTNVNELPFYADEAKKLTGYEILTVLNDSEVEIPTSSAVFDAIESAIASFVEVTEDEINALFA